MRISSEKRTSKSPIGVNVLRNDAIAALSIAHACEANFIRVNVLSGAVVSDQGLIQGRAAELVRLRHAWASPIQILADVGVKHAAPWRTYHSFSRHKILRIEAVPTP